MRVELERRETELRVKRAIAFRFNRAESASAAIMCDPISATTHRGPGAFCVPTTADDDVAAVFRPSPPTVSPRKSPAPSQPVGAAPVPAVRRHRSSLHSSPVKTTDAGSPIGTKPPLRHCKSSSCSATTTTTTNGSDVTVTQTSARVEPES